MELVEKSKDAIDSEVAVSGIISVLQQTKLLTVAHFTGSGVSLTVTSAERSPKLKPAAFSVRDRDVNGGVDFSHPVAPRNNGGGGGGGEHFVSGNAKTLQRNGALLDGPAGSVMHASTAGGINGPPLTASASVVQKGPGQGTTTGADRGIFAHAVTDFFLLFPL